MDYGLNEMQEMVRDLARKIAEERILPERARLDDEEAYPKEIMKTLSDSDMLGIYIPEEYGGMGGGCMELSIAIEELSKVCGGVAVCYAANALGAYPILWGSHIQCTDHVVPSTLGACISIGARRTRVCRIVSGIVTAAIGHSIRDNVYDLLHGSVEVARPSHSVGKKIDAAG